MNRKLVAIAMLMLSALLSGCTHEQGAQTEKPADTVTLDVYYGTVHNTPMMNALAADYEEQFGVAVNWLPADDGTANLKKLITLGQTPDLFSLGQFNLAAWESYLYDLSSEPWAGDIYEDSLEAARVDGKLYAWPHVIEASGIVYNKDIFEQAGIGQIPSTLQELQKVCDTLSSQGIRSFGESWMEYGYLAHMLAAPFMMEDEEKITSQIREGEKSFSDLKYIRNMFTFFDMTLDYGLGDESVAYNTLSQYPDFANGTMAMMKQGTWVERDVARFADDYHIGIFPLPLSQNAEENKLHTATTTFLCVNRESDHLEEALAFLRWWHEHADTYLVEIDGVVPPFYSIDTENITGQLNRDMMQYMESGNVFNGFGYEFWPQGFQHNLADPLQQYVLGNADYDETIQVLDRLFRN